MLHASLSPYLHHNAATIEHSVIKIRNASNQAHPPEQRCARLTLAHRPNPVTRTSFLYYSALGEARDVMMWPLKHDFTEWMMGLAAAVKIGLNTNLCHTGAATLLWL